jgi:hypothetical protein
MKTEVNTQIEINDLVDVGTELSSEELLAVSGAATMEPSWSCGARKLTDEWNVN